MPEEKNTVETVFSPCGEYRYLFKQQWDQSKPWVMFIGLNPTEIDPIKLNATLRRCIVYAKDWQYGGICMANLFAALAATPEILRTHPDPVGTDNNHWLEKLSGEAGLIIAAWGNDGCYLDRGQDVRKQLNNLHCLKINQSGEPAHPLYQPKSAKPISYRFGAGE
ncbi:MAG: DUF1643 domain-containing protein [Motiliproteus sp.]|nr:DUF1643 domain-containing protein [Motiliproteus sp.]MCW9053019.1 DUF1643 domain-containing protein [Motiliproteus sp.]